MKRIELLLLVLGLFACSVQEKKLPQIVVGTEQSIELQPVGWSDLKNFKQDDLLEAVPAFKLSCEAVLQRPEVLREAQIQIEPSAYINICRRFLAEDVAETKAFRQFLVDNFRPYLVLEKLNPQGRFTSYYEAELRAAKYRHGKYQYPIYGRPNDLLEINLQDFDKTLPRQRLLGRAENGKIVPYYTRAEISRGGVDAPVVLWGDDAVDIYLMQIQGSAVALLDDGTAVRIRYADNNGHEFVGIGSVLLKKGLLQPGQASMDKIRDWLKANPEKAKENMDENPRFIFHKLSDAPGPIGALGVPLTAGRSLAVDSRYIPLGSLIWLETTGPDKQPIEKLVAAQDTGGAIKGVVRGDYFWGHGEQALFSAGKMSSPGQYYILLPRNTEVKISDR